MKNFYIIWGHLIKKEKVNIILLVVLMLFGGLLEVIGIGAIIPIIGLIADPELIKNNTAMTVLIDFLGNPTDKNLLIYFLVIFFLFIVLKNIFSLFITWFTTQVTFKHRERIVTTIFHKYLNINYVEFIKSNTSNYINIILKDVPSYDNFRGFIA